ncbi:MAG: hypothetical protein V1749_04745 [Candidatus Desantisbacteria bacterium]
MRLYLPSNFSSLVEIISNPWITDPSGKSTKNVFIGSMGIPTLEDTVQLAARTIEYPSSPVIIKSGAISIVQDKTCGVVAAKRCCG